MWDKYSHRPKRLQHEAELLRRMNGFGQPEEFYQGVAVNESWEKDFKPIPGTVFTPVKLVMVLDLYFRLTPITMVPETPEIIELGRVIHATPAAICQAMEVFQGLDPYLSREAVTDSPLAAPCQALWQRFGNDGPEPLAIFAAQVKDYFL